MAVRTTIFRTGEKGSGTSKKKTIVIVVVTLAVVALLVILAGRQFVGKAIGTLSTVGNANVVLGTAHGDGTQDIVIQANTGSEAVGAVDFTLFSDDLDLCAASVTLTSTFNVLSEKSCTARALSYAAAAPFGQQPSGLVTVATIKVPIPAAPAEFSFPKFALKRPADLSNIVSVVSTETVTVDFSGAPTDTDGDGVPDSSDNCPSDANANQADQDSDTTGDVCDTTPCGANAALSGTCQCNANFENTNGLWSDGCEGTTGGDCLACQSLDDLFSAAIQSKKESLCTGVLEAGGDCTAANIGAFCQANPSICKKYGYSADLDINDKIDVNDAFMVLFVDAAIKDDTCGSEGSSPCQPPPGGVLACDDGSLRIQGSTIYNKVGSSFVSYSYDSAHKCPYSMEVGK